MLFLDLSILGSISWLALMVGEHSALLYCSSTPLSLIARKAFCHNKTITTYISITLQIVFSEKLAYYDYISFLQQLFAFPVVNNDLDSFPVVSNYLIYFLIVILNFSNVLSELPLGPWSWIIPSLDNFIHSGVVLIPWHCKPLNSFFQVSYCISM